jgi:hypothetical protein
MSTLAPGVLWRGCAGKRWACAHYFGLANTADGLRFAATLSFMVRAPAFRTAAVAEDSAQFHGDVQCLRHGAAAVAGARRPIALSAAHALSRTGHHVRRRLPGAPPDAPRLGHWFQNTVAGRALEKKNSTKSAPLRGPLPDEDRERGKGIQAREQNGPRRMPLRLSRHTPRESASFEDSPWRPAVFSK